MIYSSTTLWISLLGIPAVAICFYLEWQYRRQKLQSRKIEQLSSTYENDPEYSGK